MLTIRCSTNKDSQEKHGCSVKIRENNHLKILINQIVQHQPFVVIMITSLLIKSHETKSQNTKIERPKKKTELGKI